jgi:hypothetical protein
MKKCATENPNAYQPPKRKTKKEEEEEEGEKKSEYFYFCFMRARRSATEVSFSIFASLLPKV